MPTSVYELNDIPSGAADGAQAADANFNLLDGIVFTYLVFTAGEDVSQYDAVYFEPNG